MKLARALSTFVDHAAFRLGFDAAGRRLLADLQSDDENVRALAGMFLVKSGRRSLPLLRAALERREEVPNVLTMLGDIAAPETEGDIQRFVNDQDPSVAKAARDALEAMKRNLALQAKR